MKLSKFRKPKILRKCISSCLAVALISATCAPLFVSGEANALYSDYQHELLSKNNLGFLGNDDSDGVDISSDGRFAVFKSTASNLVDNDTNNVADIFVKDRQTNQIRRVSVASGGIQSNGISQEAKISGNGRYVVYTSLATNLIPNDINNSRDVFLYDLQLNTNTLVTSDSTGALANLGGHSPDVDSSGSTVVFSSASHNLVPGYNPYEQRQEVYSKNTVTGETKMVSKAPNGNRGNQGSGGSSINCDGTVIAFGSTATNLTPELSNDPQGVFQKQDIFIAKKNNSDYTITEVTNTANYHSASANVSCDGKFLALTSGATNLLEDEVPANGGYQRVYKYDIEHSDFQIVSARYNNDQIEIYGNGNHPSVSGDGRYVVFSSNNGLDNSNYAGVVGNTNFTYVSDTVTRITRNLSINPYNKIVTSNVPVISSNGDIVAYTIEGYNYTVQNMGYDDPTRAIVSEDNTSDTDVYSTRNILKSVDSLSPYVLGSQTINANTNGWHKQDVTINWTATDPAPSSGTPTQPPATVADREGEQAYTSAPSCDPAGNCATGSLTVKLDKSAPEIIATLSAPATVDGWHNAPVTVSFNCSDAVSGIDSCTAPVTVSDNGGTIITGTATDKAGNTMSINVIVAIDKDKPTVTQSVSPSANAAGWHKSDVTVAASCQDAISGILSCEPASTVLSAETTTAGQTVNATATDRAGNVQSASTTIKLDKTAPVLGAANWSLNPKPVTSGSNLSVPVTENLSGLAEGEYFIGDNDPGQGNGATMSITGGNLSTAFGTDFPSGVYKISYRARDVAGNWSAIGSEYLVVTSTVGTRVSGKDGKLTPSLARGDVLPGLVNGEQTEAADMGFTVEYLADGTIKANSDFQFKYVTGSKCNKPTEAVNCHSFELNATSISWLATQGTNNSAGIFQGIASLVLDGQASSVPFRVTAVDGGKLTPAGNDTFQLQVFAPGADPNTAQPVYRVNTVAVKDVRVN